MIIDITDNYLKILKEENLKRRVERRLIYLGLKKNKNCISCIIKQRKSEFDFFCELCFNILYKPTHFYFHPFIESYQTLQRCKEIDDYNLLIDDIKIYKRQSLYINMESAIKNKINIIYGKWWKNNRKNVLLTQYKILKLQFANAIMEKDFESVLIIKSYLAETITEIKNIEVKEN
jgi:hypothetical protein